MKFYKLRFTVESFDYKVITIVDDSGQPVYVLYKQGWPNGFDRAREGSLLSPIDVRFQVSELCANGWKFRYMRELEMVT